MDNKISFLGSAGDIKTVGKLRSSGGIIVVTEGFQFHINPGVGALENAKEMKLDLRETDVIINTHNNIISNAELKPVIEYLTLSGEDNHGIFLGGHNAVGALEDSFKERFERVIGLNPGDKVGLGDVDVKARKIGNIDTEGVGLIIDSPSFRMGYVPPTRYSITIAKEFEGVDILIIDIKNRDGAESHNMNLDEAVTFVEHAKPRLVVISGLGFKMASMKPIEIIREIQKKTHIQTMVAADGMVINASSYRRVKQEKLE